MDRQPKQTVFDRSMWTLGVLALALVAMDALAEGDKATAASDPTWQAECGSCHVPYPPRMLPTRSWHAIMASLDRHFGVDATVDAAAASAIGSFLQRNGGRERVASLGVPPLRITETAWFRHEHGRLATAAWQNPQVKSAANCGACHAGAGNGRFSEHDVRIPGRGGR